MERINNIEQSEETMEWLDDLQAQAEADYNAEEEAKAKASYEAEQEAKAKWEYEQQFVGVEPEEEYLSSIGKEERWIKQE